ncbi:MAG TPA: hypothetical protein VN845_05605, partial [Solirubrobacteraceae bacterium]|nr:hypothetical protein [Solirubrobacteraceae bacterium]
LVGIAEGTEVVEQFWDMLCRRGYVCRRAGVVVASADPVLNFAQLPGAPILTIHSAEALLGRTFKPTHDAIERLIEAGILKPVTIDKRSRAYEAPEIIDAFTALERQLASPHRDTRTSPPVRRVPYRPRRARTKAK